MIGILLDAEPSHGGVFQYSMTVVDALTHLQEFTEGDAGIALVHTPTSVAPFSWEQLPPRWSVVALDQGSFTSNSSAPTNKWLDAVRRLVGEGVHREAWRLLRDRFQPGWRYREPKPAAMEIDRIDWKPHVGQALREFGIDLMLYPTPNALSFEIGIPFIMAIPDLQHRLQPEFPEVSAPEEWERREYVFRNAARYATLLLADSEVGKEDILNCYGEYGIAADRVDILPFLPAIYPKEEIPPGQRQGVLDKYGLKQPFLFYPAQFWPHKNHQRIVQALALAARQWDLYVEVAFAGSKNGALREQTFVDVMRTAQTLDVADRVRYLGYAPDDDMASLYQSASALIMPTFFGPTNIPPLEAWSFGCPVITSDIRGIRQQMGDAALLVDPRSVESIANAIREICTDEDLRSRLVAAGQRRLLSYTRDDFGSHLQAALAHARQLCAAGSFHTPDAASQSVKQDGELMLYV